jgi:DNA-binding transcriptional LysR family regulator
MSMLAAEAPSFEWRARGTLLSTSLDTTYPMGGAIPILKRYAMELRHLQQFVAVAEEKHITRAAERLGMQQPPLSQRIKGIENELGIQLFKRKARGVDLTAAGRIFFNHARLTIAQHERGLDATKRAARGEQGQLRVGVPPTAPFHPLLPAAIRAFREAYPSVSLTMDECLRAELVGRLQDERMDVAFIRAPLSKIDGLTIYPLCTEPMMAALPTGHPLARKSARGGLPLSALSDDTFIAYAREQGPAIYEATVAACLKAGFSPRLGQEAPRVTSALSLVAAGLGIAIVPASMRRMGMENVVYRDVRSATQLKAFLRISTRSNESSIVVQNFLTIVRRMARDFPNG